MNVKPILGNTSTNGFARPILQRLTLGDGTISLKKWEVTDLKRGDRVEIIGFEVIPKSVQITRKYNLHFGQKHGVIRWNKLPTNIGTIQEVRQHPFRGEIKIEVSINDEFLIRVGLENVKRIS